VYPVVASILHRSVWNEPAGECYCDATALQSFTGPSGTGVVPLLEPPAVPASILHRSVWNTAWEVLRAIQVALQSFTGPSGTVLVEDVRVDIVLASILHRSVWNQAFRELIDMLVELQSFTGPSGTGRPPPRRRPTRRLQSFTGPSGTRLPSLPTTEQVRASILHRSVWNRPLLGRLSTSSIGIY